MTDEPKVPNFSEAPASWNTKYIDPSGFECQITLRANNGSDLLKKAASCLEALIKQGSLPVTHPTSNGHTNGGTASSQEEIRICTIHDAEMKKHEKDGQVWYSHKLASDGTYCKGKK